MAYEQEWRKAHGCEDPPLGGDTLVLVFGIVAIIALAILFAFLIPHASEII